MITVGACSNQVELAELCRLHEACRAKYHSTVFDTRCVVFSKHSDSDNVDGDNINGGDNTENGDIVNDNNDDNENSSDEPPTWFSSHSHKTQLLQYHGNSYHAALHADVQDFINSLFWVLEKKRVEASLTIL